MRVLLIADHYPSAQSLMSALAHIDSSYEITHVTTLVAAARELHSCASYDVALIELDLLGRQQPAQLLADFPDVALVAFVGKQDPRLLADAVTWGVRDFLQNGVHRPQAIDMALRCALERHDGDGNEDRYVLFHTLAEVDEGSAVNATAFASARGMAAASAALDCDYPRDSTQMRSLANELYNELNVVALEADVIQLAVGCGESVQVDQSVARIHQKCSAVASIIRQLNLVQN